MSGQQVLAVVSAIAVIQVASAFYIGACVMELKSVAHQIRGDMNQGFVELPRKLNEAR